MVNENFSTYRIEPSNFLFQLTAISKKINTYMINTHTPNYHPFKSVVQLIPTSFVVASSLFLTIFVAGVHDGKKYNLV